MRVLFAFDKERRAILLVGGDKSGDWAGWYARNILIADDLFDEHQAALAARQPVGKRRPLGSGEDRGTGEGNEPEGLGEQGLESPGAAGRVAAIEDELRLAAGLTALREEAGCRSGNWPGASA